MSEDLTYPKALDLYNATYPIAECKLKLFEEGDSIFELEGVILEHTLPGERGKFALIGNRQAFLEMAHRILRKLSPSREDQILEELRGIREALDLQNR